MHRINQFGLLAALGVSIGGIHLSSGTPGPANTITVAGPTADQPAGTAWGVTVCPERGAVAVRLAFITHGSVDGGEDGGAATVIVEDHTTDAVMCSMEVACAQPVTSTVTVACDAGVTCAGGDVVHIEWASSSCQLGAFPKGAASGTLQEL